MTLNTTKTALITGASRGLGLALAQEMARAGWQLVINARGADALSEAVRELAQITKVTAIAGDVTDAAHRQALAEAAQQMGGLDAVVNNASILGSSPQPNLLDYPLDVLEAVYRTNVIAPLAILQAVRGSLKSGARIINVSSDAGAEAYPGWGGYGSSKAALEHLSAIFAAENPDYKVYWVDPGDMRTQMHQEAFPGEDISDRALPEESVPGLMALLTGDYPNGRYQARAVGVNHVETGLREFRVALTVNDLDKAVTFYRDGAGLPVLQEWNNEGGRGFVLDAGRATLELLDESQSAWVDNLEAGRRVSDKVRLALQVPDTKAAADSLIHEGGTAVHSIVLTPWGDRNQRLQAPDGMQITLFQAAAESPEEAAPTLPEFEAGRAL